ncbi:MAG: ABC transporter substrate-binding protein, partial [Anaerolineae bacterium]
MSKKTLINLFLVLTMLLTLGVGAASAAPPAAEVLAQEELTYTVKLGDNLWTLAEKYLGTGPAYWVIVGATNAKHEGDSSFAYIENPSLIHPGWKLLIPSAEAAEAYIAISKAVPSAGKTGLRVTFAWPTYIDPAVGSDFSSTSSLCNLYDTLVFPNTEGGVDAHLAESWDVSDDGLTWTFHLKQGVKFHNGSELTASDVAFSMNRLLEIGEGLAYVFLGTVEDATAPDDYTVEFKLAQPSGLFLI